MDFHSTSLSPVFHSKIRKCYNCKKESDQMSVCGQCKVFAFCSKECQISAWKRVHKQNCRPLDSNTPREIDTWNKAFMEPDGIFHYITKITKIHDDNSLDHLYKYILIKPRGNNGLIIEDVVGINEDSDLDTYTDKKEGESDEYEIKLNKAVVNICKRYSFPTMLERSNLPGFTARLQYNDYNIFAYFDDNCKNSDAAPNPSADVLLMTKNMRGNVILIAYKGHGVYGSEVIPISLRDVYWLMQHIYDCGAKGCVPERAHFDNIERREVANWLSSKNVKTYNL